MAKKSTSKTSKKVAKKVTKKASKKASKKVAPKVKKKVAKKVTTKKVTKKAKKVVKKKATATKKIAKVAKKTKTKAAKKITKKVASKVASKVAKKVNKKAKKAPITSNLVPPVAETPQATEIFVGPDNLANRDVEEVSLDDLHESTEGLDEDPDDRPASGKLSDEYNPDDELDDVEAAEYSYGWSYNDAFDSPENVDEEDFANDEDQLYTKGEEDDGDAIDDDNEDI